MRIRQAAMVAATLQPVVDDLCEVFGLEVSCNDPGVGEFGLENAVIPVGDTFLEVVAPIQEGTAAGRLLERGFVHTIEHEELGPIRLLGWPARMSESHVDIQASPLLGKHTEEVLAEDLGLEEDAIRALREAGAIGDPKKQRKKTKA